MSEKIPYKFKMVLLGESGSGKTSLFERIIYDTFEETLEKKEPTALTSPTDDREPLTMSGPYRNRTKQLLVSGNAVKVTVFDTGGEERVDYMTLHYYENAKIVCLVYAVDSLASLTGLNAWVDDAQEYLALKTLHSAANPVFALVGVKSDIPFDAREVSPEHVKQAAKQFEISEDCCFTVSSASGDGVAEMVQHLAQKTFNLHATPTNAEMEDNSSIISAQLRSTREPVSKEISKCKQWLCYCLCCKRCDYETINST